MDNVAYRIMCRKVTSPNEWQKKTTCTERWQAEKFIGILETASDMYLEFKIESVPVPNNERKV